MIVKNEASVLDHCLQSIQGIDEIVILDTGSTDSTGEVARKYTDKYIAGEYTWNDNFAEARNKALSYCTGDWVLVIDADEILEPEGVFKIRALVNSLPPEIRGVGFRTIALGGQAEHESVRLHRRAPDIVWHSPVHNYLSVLAEAHTDIKLYYGYSPAHKLDPDRALRILEKYCSENKDAVREKFYLAREYYYRKEYERAILMYKKYLEVAYWQPEMVESFVQIAKCQKELNRIDQAKLACFMALSLNADCRTPYMLLSEMSEGLNKTRWEEFSNMVTDQGSLFKPRG